MQSEQPVQARTGNEEIEEELEDTTSTRQAPPEGRTEGETQAQTACPVCLGSGSVSTSVIEGGWQTDGAFSGPLPLWDSRLVRRRRWRGRSRSSWRKPCQALLVSIVYITLALALGFLGVSFYPRNPDFDLVDVRFTKLQLRWERNPWMTGSQIAAEAGNEAEDETATTARTSQPQKEHSRATFALDGSSVAALAWAIESNDTASDVAVQDFSTLGEDMGNMTEFLEDELKRADENGVTIFGRRLVLDIDLMVTVLVKNPNNVGVHYEASSLDIIYKGKKLGDALLPPGQQAAASSRFLEVPAQLNGLSTIGMSFALLRDWGRRSVEMDIAARFTGTVDLIRLIPHEFIADMFCDVLTNPRNLTILRRHCQWKYSGRI